MNLQQVKANMALDLYGQTKDQAVASGNCIQCKEPAIPKCYSEVGKREFYILGLCEECFDNIIGGFQYEDAEDI